MWPRLLDLDREECLAILRRLELEAYSSVVSALRAQGDLTRERRRVLQELSSIFNVSIERHRTEIRRAVNDELLATIAKSASASSGLGDHEWLREGRRLIPLLPRAPPSRTAARSTADAARVALDEHNQTLRAPSDTLTAPRRIRELREGMRPLEQLVKANGTVENVPSVALPRLSEENAAANVVVLPSGQAVRITPKTTKINRPKTTSTKESGGETKKASVEGRPTKRRRGKHYLTQSKEEDENDLEFKDAKIEVFPSIQHLQPSLSLAVSSMPSVASTTNVMRPVMAMPAHRPLVWTSSQMPPPLKRPYQAARHYSPAQRSAVVADTKNVNLNANTEGYVSSEQNQNSFYKPSTTPTSALALGQGVALSQGIMTLEATPSLYTASNGDSSSMEEKNKQKFFKPVSSDTIAIPVVSFPNKTSTMSATTTTEAPSFILLQRTPAAAPIGRNVTTVNNASPRIVYTKTGKPLVIVSKPIATHNNVIESTKCQASIKEPGTNAVQVAQASVSALETTKSNLVTMTDEKARIKSQPTTEVAQQELLPSSSVAVAGKIAE